MTPEHETVWKFANPFKNMMGGPATRGWTTKAGSKCSMASFATQMGMKEDQRKKLDEIDKELIAKLEKTLTAEQKKILAEPVDFDFSKFPAPGEFLSAFKKNKLKLTDSPDERNAGSSEGRRFEACKDLDRRPETRNRRDQKQVSCWWTGRTSAGRNGRCWARWKGWGTSRWTSAGRTGWASSWQRWTSAAWVTRCSEPLDTRSTTLRSLARRSSQAKRSWKSSKNWIKRSQNKETNSAEPKTAAASKSTLRRCTIPAQTRSSVGPEGSVDTVF